MVTEEQPELPLEIYSNIMKFVPFQSAFRKTNTSISGLPVKQKYYCQEPTLAELVDWCWEQHILLTFKQTAKFSILTGKNYYGDEAKEVFLEFIKDKNGKQVFISLETGKIEIIRSTYDEAQQDWNVTYSDITQKTQLLEELRGFRLFLEYFDIVNNLNWPTSRDILSKRLDPRIHNNFLLSDICFIDLISQKFPTASTDTDWNVIINGMHNILEPEPASSMTTQFLEKFFRDNDQNVDIKIPPNVFNTWLSWFISTLTPLDLHDDVRLRRNLL